MPKQTHADARTIFNQLTPDSRNKGPSSDGMLECNLHHNPPSCSESSVEELVFGAQVNLIAGLDEGANGVIVVISGAAQNIRKDVIGIGRILRSNIRLLGGSLVAVGFDALCSAFRGCSLKRGQDKKILELLDIREHLQE